MRSKNDPYPFDGLTSSISMKRFEKIIQRAPAVGAKTWCLYVFYPQDAAKRQTTGIKFTHMPKIRY